MARRILASLTVGMLTTLNGSLSHAQLSDVLGGATEAAASQRTQAQIQERVQTQIQQRVQVDATRAVRIAEQAADIAQRSAAAARQRATSGVSVRLGAEARVRARAQAADQSASVRARARLGIDANLTLPPDLTEQDVQAYENIFGRFNPLRRPAPSDEAVADATPEEDATPPSRPGRGSRQRENDQETDDQRTDDDSENGRWRRAGSLANAFAELDLTSRINVAARQRRAEISHVRDRALASGDTQLMLRAQGMEDSLNAFVAEQARARAAAESVANSRPDIGPFPSATGRANATANANVQGNVDVNSVPRTASQAQAAGEAAASGSGSLRR